MIKMKKYMSYDEGKRREEELFDSLYEFKYELLKFVNGDEIGTDEAYFDYDGIKYLVLDKTEFYDLVFNCVRNDPIKYFDFLLDNTSVYTLDLIVQSKVLDHLKCLKNDRETLIGFFDLLVDYDKVKKDLCDSTLDEFGDIVGATYIYHNKYYVLNMGNIDKK